jgi:hypothetical protein
MNFGEDITLDINYLIYESLSTIAYRFIEANQELFETKSDEFEIYTNYLDSHVRFSDEEVQVEFEKYF